MKNLIVQIEINGTGKYVGNIKGSSSEDAVFSYAENYLADPDCRPVSISLPLERRVFDVVSTKNFFEGLLPEGFTRRCVAARMHADENDYLSILAEIGRECLGAVKIFDENDRTDMMEYRKLSAEEVLRFAREGASESAELVARSHLSLTGASGKAGLYYDEKKGEWYLPVGEAPSTHIVKQSHVRLEKIVTNEQLCLLAARNLGIEIPESFIIQAGNQDEEVLFATKRYDRKILPGNRRLNGLVMPYRLHQEDFAQALGIASAEKYEKNNAGYLRKMVELIRNYSAEPLKDQLKLWDICIFNFLIGNTDNHIKNFSLLYSEDLKSVRLAPAYDMISTVIYESSTENMALGINGKYDISDLKQEDFAAEAAWAGIGVKNAMKRFDIMASRFEGALKEACRLLMEQGFSEADSICGQIMAKRGRYIF